MNFLQNVDPIVLRQVLLVSSTTLWTPLLGVFIYTSATSPIEFVHNTTSIICIGSLVIGMTVYSAMCASGDWLMLISALAGFLGDVIGFHDTCYGTPSSNPGTTGEEEHTRNVYRTRWLVGCLLFGMAAGILCKTKDIAEGRYSKRYYITERLYIVTPFAIGECAAHLLSCGWRGFLDVIYLNFLSLATVGFVLLVHHILKKAGLYGTDLIGALTTLFTSSFGVVAGVTGLTSASVYFVAIPMMQKLFNMNTLLSSFGIAMEVIFYDVL
eukprot:PhF_6_TR38925/c0_g1_i2/m.58233